MSSVSYHYDADRSERAARVDSMRYPLSCRNEDIEVASRNGRTELKQRPRAVAEQWSLLPVPDYSDLCHGRRAKKYPDSARGRRVRGRLFER